MNSATGQALRVISIAAVISVVIAVTQSLVRPELQALAFAAAPGLKLTFAVLFTAMLLGCTIVMGFVRGAKRHCLPEPKGRGEGI